MRDLQNELIPILTPLIKGDWSDFDEGRASRIAMWLTVMTTVTAMSYRQTLGVTTDERQHIHENRTVPPNWQMWVGRASGFEDVTYSNHANLITRGLKFPINGAEPNSLITTFVIGQLLLQCISVPFEELLVNPIPYGFDKGIFPIHPWGGGDLDWRYIPVIRDGSAEFEDVKEWFYRNRLFPLITNAMGNPG